jgi:hypothetical protein
VLVLSAGFMKVRDDAALADVKSLLDCMGRATARLTLVKKDPVRSLSAMLKDAIIPSSGRLTA